MRLAGLAFETTSQRLGSICAVGCTLLKADKVIDCKEWWICPHTAFHSKSANVSLPNGRNYWKIKDCFEFPVAWKELQPMLLAADCVIMHKAPADLKHLRSVLAFYQLAPISFAYADSMELSRQLFPGRKTYNLKAVAAHLGVVLRKCYPLESATARAMIAYRLGIPADEVKQFST